jgi:SAM-dependent methyltransferase
VLLYTRALEAFPRLKQRLFRLLYQYLGRYEYADWTFMNYGYYTPLHSGEALKLFAADEPDRYCIQLYECVTASAQLKGRSLLEIGCGRGGGLSYLHRYRGPRMSRGLDIAPRAVAVCRARHVHPGVGDLWFRVGDALATDYDDGAFDVVVNVESSHCYPSRFDFFLEVRRVLKPGGTFCYADLHETEAAAGIESALRDASFDVIQREDLTPGVLRSLAADDSRKREQILARAPWFLRRAFNCFAGVVGSRTHRSFVVGARQYTRWLLQKV